MRFLPLALFVLAAGASACRTPSAAAAAPNEDVVEQYPDELQIQDLVVGAGEPAADGNTVTVHYTGTLTSGKVFDSSLTRDEPFTFTLGDRKVIRGWDMGLLGMKVGGKRKLTIPPRLGYGSKDLGTIPPNSFLVFEVQLLAIKP